MPRKSRSRGRKKKDKKPTNRHSSYSSSSRSDSYQKSRSRSRKSISSQRRWKKNQQRYDKFPEKSYSQTSYRPEINVWTPKNEDSNWLYINDLENNMQDQIKLISNFLNFFFILHITKQQIEDELTRLSQLLSTTIHEEVKLVPFLSQAYISFPSVQVATKVLFHIKGQIKLGDKYYETDYYQSGQKKVELPAYLVEQPTDWICEKCDYNNFAKRTKCHKCDKPKNQVCKVLVNTKATTQQPQIPDTINTSLMVRGHIVQQISESQLLDAFGKQSTGEQRDFAFVEFYTLKEAEDVLAKTQQSDFTLLGEPVQVYFSKNRRPGEDSLYGVYNRNYQSAVMEQQMQYYNYLNMQQVEPEVVFDDKMGAVLPNIQNQNYNQTQPYYQPQIAQHQQYMSPQVVQQMTIGQNQFGQLGYGMNQPQQPYEFVQPQMQIIEPVKKIKQREFKTNTTLQKEQPKVDQKSDYQKLIQMSLAYDDHDPNKMPQPIIATLGSKNKQNINKIIESPIIQTPSLRETEQFSLTKLAQQTQQVSQKTKIQKQQQIKTPKAPDSQQKLLEEKAKEKKKIKQIEQEIKKFNKLQNQQLYQEQLDLEALQNRTFLIICSICKRKFPNEETLKQHDKLSSVHQQNLKIIQQIQQLQSALYK